MARSRVRCRSAASFQNTVSNTALSPDGLPNYGLRSVPQYTAGVNTPDSIININDTRLLARGFNVGLLDPDHTEGRVQDWNLTFEKEILDEHRPEHRLCRQLRRPPAAGDPLQRRHSGLHLVCHQESAAADGPVRQRGDAAVRSAGLREHHAVCANWLWPLQRSASSNWSGASAAVSRIRFSGTSGTHYSSTATPTTRRASMRCRASTRFLPGAVPTDFEGTEPLPELQARSEYAEAPDPLELYRRTAVRTRKEASSAIRKGWRGQAGWRLADCRHR